MFLIYDDFVHFSLITGGRSTVLIFEVHKHMLCILINIHVYTSSNKPKIHLHIIMQVGPDGLCFFSGLLFYSQKFHLLFFSPSPLFLNYSYNNI